MRCTQSKFLFVSLFIISSLTASQSTFAASTEGFHGRFLKVLVEESGHKRVIADEAFVSNAEVPLVEESYPQTIIEHQPVDGNTIVEVRSTNKVAVAEWLRNQDLSDDLMLEDDVKSNTLLETDDQDEVRTLVSSGSPQNRIDLVFMGDGYTLEEKEKFFSDMDRLVKDMFVGQTFTAYLPLFNVHAVFRASKVSGIGMGQATSTAFGLYREGETLRAIFAGNKSAIRAACRKAPACDYPVVIANDPYYGGLGGEFAISTSSPTSGTLVLRHELGHNFGKVGEEYDGGGYFGANHSYSAPTVSWSHWSTLKETKAEPMFARYLAWPWQRLDKKSFQAKFKSDGKQARTFIQLSASGIETDDTLSITLDGQPVAFRSPNRSDRSFINIHLPGLSAGEHTFEVSEQVHDQNNWLSNITIHEYNADAHSEKDFVGAFPVFNEDLRVDGYRPTDNSCLMREMEHPFFCPICQENNWLNFFNRVSLIDSLTVEKKSEKIFGDLKILELGQYRSAGTGTDGEQLIIRWFQNDKELTDLAGKTTWSLPASTLARNASIEARVSLESKQIRKEKVAATKSVRITDAM